MTSVFRTAGAWGAGLGRPLTWVEQDNNTYDKETRLTDLESLISVTGGGAVGIANIEISGGVMTITMTDSSIYTFDITELAIAWSPQGTWQPSTLYHALDVVTYGGTAYLVNIDHTSDTTFDPEAVTGSNEFYTAILSYAPAPGQTISTSTYSPTLTDASTYMRLTNASGCAITIDPDLGWPDWTELHFRDCSTDTSAFCTFEVSTPGSINPVIGKNEFQSAGAGAVITMKKVGATDDWDIYGMLANA